MARILTAVAVLALSGCASTQNVTSAQIKRPESLRVSETVKMTIPQIQAALFHYTYTCRTMAPLRIDPADPRHAIIVTDTMGLTKASVGALADFRQFGDETRVEYYSYYSTWDKWGNDLIQAIKHPDRCE